MRALILYLTAVAVLSNCELTQQRSPKTYTVKFSDLKHFQDNNEDFTDTQEQSAEQTELFKLVDINGSKINVEDRAEKRGVIYAQSRIRSLKSNHRKDKERLVSNWEEHLNVINDVDAVNKEKKLVCYYNVPGYEDRPFAVFPEQIDPHLCTHIILGFSAVRNATIQPSNLKDLEFYNRTLALRKLNSALKVMLTVGGAGNSSEFHDMVASNVTRSTFISSCLSLVKQFPFDGMDFDWEFPAWPGPLQERDDFLRFLQEFRSELDKNGKGNFILSAAVSAPKAVTDMSYRIPEMAKVVDFVNLMTYDFHFYSWYSSFTGPNAPLFPSKNDYGLLDTMNTAWAAKYWYQSGMPAEKIVVGVPTYGHSWRLVDSRNHEYLSLAGGYGAPGVKGFAGYPEICQFLQKNGTQYVFDKETQVPYAFNDQDWVSFDNEQSATRKAQWVNEFNLGGVMMYCINSDDAWKMCNTSKVNFPIINAVKAQLLN